MVRAKMREWFTVKKKELKIQEKTEFIVNYLTKSILGSVATSLKLEEN